MLMTTCVTFFSKCTSMRVRDTEREGEKEIGRRSSFLIKKKTPTGLNLFVRDNMFYHFDDKISYIVGILNLFTVAICYKFLF